jgi:PKD repeat protein
MRRRLFRLALALSLVSSGLLPGSVLAESDLPIAHPVVTVDEANNTVRVPLRRGYGPALVPAERMALGQLSETESRKFSRRSRVPVVGVSRRINARPAFIADDRRPGLPTGRVVLESDGARVWVAAFSSEGADGLRLRLEVSGVPKGTRAVVYSVNGEEHGPYEFREDGPAEVWTNTVFGSELFLEVTIPAGADISRSQIAVTDLIHLKLGVFSEQVSSSDDPALCLMDANCVLPSEYADLALARRAIAHISFIEGGSSYVCTGSLLNDTATSGTPYFLTANHCLHSQAVASTLEAFWDYTTGACGAAPPQPSGFPRTLGSTLLATSETSDFTLLRLSQTPPPGRVFLGWDPRTYTGAEGMAAYRLHHPLGLPLAYERVRITASPAPIVCSGAPVTDFIYSKRVVGATQGGSSGSSLLLPGGYVIGQLFGACGLNYDDDCDAVLNSNIDGSLATTFPLVRQWLNPQGPNADYVWSPMSPFVGQHVTFSDRSTGAPTSWQWAFGDGTSSSSPNPSKAFLSAGTFVVSLTVSSPLGSHSVSRAIAVQAVPTAPAAVFSFTPAAPQAGGMVQFADGSTGSPTSWSWSFGDGTTSTARNPSKSFASAGTYLVRLTVGNQYGSHATTRSVTVLPSVGRGNCTRAISLPCPRVVPPRG